MSINKVILCGNLTRDPELRATASGASVLAIGLAVNDRYRDQSGEWLDRPNFVDCEVWGRRADALAKYLAKGAKVCVEGRLRWHSWEGKDGAKRSKLTVTVDELEMMGKGHHGAPAQQAAPAPDERAAVKAAYPDAQLYDEDVPF